LEEPFMTRALPLLAALAIVIAGCGAGPAATTPEPAADPSMLAAADLADGVEDQIVVRCAVCSLAMDGTTDHVSAHAGYEFRFCSGHCKETFDADPARILARLKPVAADS
jgi:YHS domain-containing protein